MVHINGKDIDAAGQSLAAYLKANDYEMGTFVVECNEEIIHKEDYENYMLKDGDIIEIVQFMGGGSIPVRTVTIINIIAQPEKMLSYDSIFLFNHRKFLPMIQKRSAGMRSSRS